MNNNNNLLQEDIQEKIERVIIIIRATSKIKIIIIITTATTKVKLIITTIIAIFIIHNY